VTTKGRIGWELAGLDVPPSIDTTGWRRPRSVTLDGDDLVFDWWEDMRFHARSWRPGRVGTLPYDQWRDARRFLMSFGIAEVYPSRALLLRFAQLAEAPAERIRLYAAKCGALQEQVSDDPAWTPPPLLPDRQPLAYWRGISRSFARALDLAALPGRTLDQEANLLWLVNGHLFQSAVVDFLTFEGGRPRVLHGSGGLYGGLAVELLAAVAKVGLRLCEGCGGEVESGGKRFCHACRDIGVPVRLRGQRYRAKAKMLAERAAIGTGRETPG
jgi:hypothetical protein